MADDLRAAELSNLRELVENAGFFTSTQDIKHKKFNDFYYFAKIQYDLTAGIRRNRTADGEYVIPVSDMKGGRFGNSSKVKIINFIKTVQPKGTVKIPFPLAVEVLSRVTGHRKF